MNADAKFIRMVGRVYWMPFIWHIPQNSLGIVYWIVLWKVILLSISCWYIDYKVVQYLFIKINKEWLETIWNRLKTKI